jgi:drug/metabolite transporter (DMT)-like permease
MEGPGRARLAADLALLAVAAAWGLTFPLGKIVLTVLPPFMYLTLRFAIATAIMTLWARRRPGAASRRAWRMGVLAGGIFFAGYAFQTVGLTMTTASKAGFITGLSVTLVPVISAVWLRRTPGRGVVAGVAAATVGLAFLTLNEAVHIETGDLLVLGCALFFAVHIVLVGRLAGTLDPVVLATAQVWPVVAFSGLGTLMQQSPATISAALATTSASTWGLIAFMALSGTVAALIVQTWAQRFTSPSHTALMFTLEPVAAAIAATLLLGEALTSRQALGAGLILAGIVMAELNQEGVEETR